MANFLRVASLSIFSLLLIGCIDHTNSGDTTKQDINRMNGVADQIETQYAVMKGQFSGTYNGSTILLTLDVARQSSTGSSVPQPAIVGSINLAPPIFVDSAGRPMLIPYVVSGGQYVGGNDLSLVVQANGNPTTLHCRVTHHSDLDCNWYLNATAPRARFQLTRIADDRAVQPSAREFTGAYIGENADFATIKANFRTFLVAQNGSQGVPQLSIVGSLAFYRRPTDEQARRHVQPGFTVVPFMDSQYDPITGTIALRINGDNPIQVNCLVKSAEALQCLWIGAHGRSSYQSFDLVRTQQDPE